MIKHLTSMLLAIMLIVTTGISVMAYELDGDSVFVDHKDYYIKATPAMLGSSGWVDIEFRSKKYDSVDIVFQFPGTDGVVTKFIQFQEEQEVVVEYFDYEPYTVLVFDNITGGEKEETRYERIPRTRIDYVQGWSELDVEQVYTGKDGVWTKSKLEDKLVKGELYKARVWVDIPLHYRDRLLGKYSIGLKPWDKTIDEAESMGLLHLLDPWYDISWLHRKSFEIDGTAAGIQTNYTMELTVHYGAGADSGDDVYLNSKSQTDFDDIRFTESDGNTLLDYWMEDYVDSDVATFWVEFDSIPADPASGDFYIYYGNAAASNVGDITATFEWGDDFNRANGAVGGDWAVGDNTVANVVSNILRYQVDGSDSPPGGLWVDYVYSSDVILHGYGKAVNTPANKRNNLGLAADGTDDDYGLWILSFHEDAGTDKIRVLKNGGWIQVSTFNVDQWYEFELKYDHSEKEVSFYVDDVLEDADTTGFHTAGWAGYDNHVFLGPTSTAGDLDWDNIFIRKWVDPEPTWGAWGAEEEAPALGAPTAFTITQVGTNDITITWTAAIFADTTVIRGKEGSYPTDIADGYEVYNGALETVDVSGLSLATDTYYYRAWSERALVYSDDYAEDNIGGESVYFIGFIILALVPTVAAFALKNQILAFCSAGTWMLLGVYSYTQHTAVWDIHYAVFWLSAIMVLACALVATQLRTKKEEVADDGIDNIDRPLYDSFKQDEEDRGYLNKILPPRRARQAKRNKSSGWGKDGVYRSPNK